MDTNPSAAQPDDTPAYGNFGHEASTANSPKNSGANDNPDEFSEIRKSGTTATEDYSSEAKAATPDAQLGHVEQNQDPAAVAATQEADTDDSREAWAADDPRYAGGHRRQGYDDDPTHVL